MRLATPDFVNIKKSKVEIPYPNNPVQSFSPLQVNPYSNSFDSFNPVNRSYTPDSSYQTAPPLTKYTQVATTFRPQFYGGSLNFTNIPLFAYDGERGDKLLMLDVPTVNYILTGESFADKEIIDILNTFRLMGVGESYNYSDYDKGSYRKMSSFDTTIISYVPDGRTHVKNAWSGTIPRGSYIGFLLKKIDVTGVEYELSKEVRKMSQSNRKMYQFIPEVSSSPIDFIPVYGKKKTLEKYGEPEEFVTLALVKEKFNSILSEPNYNVSFLSFGDGPIDTYVDMNAYNFTIY